MSKPGKPLTEASPEVRFAANDVRLSLREWIVAAILIALGGWLIPMFWVYAEPLRREPDHRVPYRLSSDYWNYQRTCREACEGDVVLMVGDSVLWGHYVETGGTLSHYLTEMTASAVRFENLGVDGIHPVALAGLVQDFAGSIHEKCVVINCNPLWLSSPRHDLSAKKEAPFNHPTLVPQFVPRIPSYRATISERIGTAVARRVPFFGWADHLRIAYFESDDLATWTMEQPYTSPTDAVTFQFSSPDEPPSPTPDPRSWQEKGIRPITPEWVSLEESLQWRFFRQTVELLKRRDNRVFVLIGPLNEHMLSAEGLSHYNKLRRQIVAWHVDQEIAHFAPAALPSEVYADLSHPNDEGYSQLAQQMLADTAFQRFLNDRDPSARE